MALIIATLYCIKPKWFFTAKSAKRNRIEQVQGNVFTTTTKNNEAIIHERFRHTVFFRCKNIDNKRRRK